MLIVGEGKSGKTTLAHKMHDPNCELPHIDDRTKGITIKPYIFLTGNKEQNNFKLNIWDFGGQEIYHSTHRFFLSKRSLYVLVADNRKDDTDFNYWLNIIELFAGDSPLIIVLNEIDDVARTVNVSELKGRYPESIKEVLPVNFKTKEENVEAKKVERLEKIGELIKHVEHYSSCLSHIGDPVPTNWIEIRKLVEKDERTCINREDFDKICNEKNITDENDIKTLLGFFHDLGIVLNFVDNPNLRNRVILKPTWATNAVYRIFDNDSIKEKKGRFSVKNCSNIWNDKEYQFKHDILIELMKNFKLIYEINNTGNLVAPQMLPEDTPDYSWDKKDNSSLIYRFDFFMPKGIFWQFVVMMYKYINDHKLVWKNGVILEREDTYAEITENLSDRRIYIKLQGENIIEFRAIIADALSEISDSFFKLKYDIMVPCKCSVCEDSEYPHYYKLENLKRRKKKGKISVECDISYDDVSVIQLLEGFEDRSKIKEISKKERENEIEDNISEPQPLKRIFISYASYDRELMQIFKIELEAQLAAYSNKKIEIWSDKEIDIGENWDNEISNAIDKSDAALLLVSAKFLKSSYINQKELAQFFRLKKNEKFILFPVLMRNCAFQEFEKLSGLQFFKTHGSEYERYDEWRDKLIPFEEIAEVNKPSKKLLNKYAMNLAKVIVQAFE